MSNARGVDRVVDAFVSRSDSRALRLELLNEIRQVVTFDAYAWLLTDPKTHVGVSPVAEVPAISDLPKLIRLKYLTPVNRWTGLHRSVETLRAVTGDRPDTSLLWNELLAGYGVHDMASMVFRDQFGCWGWLDLWRIDRTTSFTAREVEFLRGIEKPITSALRNAQARAFDLAGLEIGRSGPVVLALSPDLEVLSQTPETADYLRRLVPTSQGRSPIPAGAYNVAAQLLAVEAEVDDHPPVARVHLDRGTWMTLRSARMGGSKSPRDQDIAVTIEPSSPTERAELYVLASGLSRREGELVKHLTTGADTRQVAERMYISTNTVQDHLKSIFAKTGAPNRRILLARALGG